ncbi:DUF3313 domain-containing protein [Tundrisphaera lichenicola]|uniref:DUF3313 domain-containing protein n=1 Tax=Tundrisphaera lichenicola TaxID=2029860 RepID=UPI003EB8CD00
MPSAERLGRRAACHCVCLLAILVINGCASYHPTRSGYLSDYSQLQKDPFHLNYGLGLERNQARNASPAEAARVDSYYIEPVQWLVSESSRGSGNLNRRQMLISALQDQLREQLGTLKPVVDQPGPNTARVRAAITDVKLSRPILNAAMLATVIAPVFIGPIFNGGGFVEAEVIGPDGRQLSAISCASGGGVLDVTGYYLKGGHARKAMRRAAKELRETLGPKP